MNQPRFNDVEPGGKDKRPDGFSTSAPTEASVITLRRTARKDKLV